ncbi:deoxyguanosinetriphosphate triphosphohydrolase-like protein [Clostridiales bacterium]|nr:deoxyguanosinetriphosphate triphosphohydrolase-like protein [Clostridiales bacterium]
MLLREKQEMIEEQILGPFATKSVDTKGREKAEEKCDIRTDFQRDRDRIIHCKAFRRMKHKTQVFIAPEGDHYRARLTHTLEVAQIARTIARALCLNEDLTEAIALGHDLGHTPFGHAGEETLDTLHHNGFRHNEQSLRVVDIIEKEGQGLNLTWEVRDGIKNHRTSCNPATMEGMVVRLSDKIAYTNHDIDDAIRAGVITDIPKEFRDVLGETSSSRINAMIRDTIANSEGIDAIKMSSDMKATLGGLREYMFKTVYLSENALKEKEKVKTMITHLYDYYMEHTDQIEGEFFQRCNPSPCCMFLFRVQPSLLCNKYHLHISLSHRLSSYSTNEYIFLLCQYLSGAAKQAPCIL